jgi:hypothetical protein
MLKPPSPYQSMGLACTTSLICVNFTHPIDIIKTRYQVGNFNCKEMIKSEGIPAFWKGIQAAWLREVFYTSTKLGGYGPIRDYLGANKKESPFYLKFMAGSLSGSIGSVIGNPFDVTKTIFKNEGIKGFYKGVYANIMRACVLNGTKMACYDQIKTAVVNNTTWVRKDLKCQFMSAFGAGFLMTCAVAPFDMVRTRLMNQEINNKIYRGFIDTTLKIYKNEGISTFYRGFFPMWFRFAPTTIIQLVIFDNLLQYCGFDSI